MISSTLQMISEHIYQYIFGLICAGIIIVVINYRFLKNITGGMLFLQISFVFNGGIIFFGHFLGEVDYMRVIHFLFYELLTVFGIYYVYTRMLKMKEVIVEKLDQLPIRNISVGIIVFNVVIMLMFSVFVSRESSRIEFMTNAWFSFVRPFMSILLPLGYFIPIHLLNRNKRVLPMAILLSAILCNIASGSRASFVLHIIGSLLIYRDIKGNVFMNVRIQVPRWIKVILGVGIIWAIKQTFNRLQVGIAELIDRVVNFGDAARIIYFSSNPSSASEGLSTFAKIHRGMARLLGDASAANVDTLFGFALTKEQYGYHNFTGPNAQISSYMLCNYAGLENVIGVLSITVYLWIVLYFFKNVSMRQWARGGVIFIPFLVNSMNNFVQDYYQGLSDVTLIVVATFTYGWYRLIRGRT